MMDFTDAYPSSRKVYVDGGAPGREVRVPMREIGLSTGEALRVYDTSGPQGGDVRQGLPPLREPWVTARGQVAAPVDAARPLVPADAGIPESSFGYRAHGTRFRRRHWCTP